MRYQPADYYYMYWKDPIKTEIHEKRLFLEKGS